VNNRKKAMRKLSIFLALFSVATTAFLHAQAPIEGKMQQQEENAPHKRKSHGAEEKRLPNEEERDPFSISIELLKKNLSEKYVNFTGEELSRFNLPRIKITGVMIFDNKAMATADIEQLGAVTLKPEEKFVFASSGAGKGSFTSFVVKEITPSELIILLEGKYEVRGRFR